MATSVAIAVLNALARNFLWVAVMLGLLGAVFMLYGSVLLIVESRMAHVNRQRSNSCRRSAVSTRLLIPQSRHRTDASGTSCGAHVAACHSAEHEHHGAERGGSRGHAEQHRTQHTGREQTASDPEADGNGRHRHTAPQCEPQQVVR